MRRSIIFTLTLILMSLISTSCDKFIPKEIEETLKEYESGIYITRVDITAGDKSLSKGTRIKLKVRFNKDWVKAYGYSEKLDELVADQVLIIYLFKDDFEKEKFNKELFEKALFEKIQKVK